MKHSKVLINGIERVVHIECEIVRYGRKTIIFREVFPNGALSKILHTTSIENLLPDDKEET